MTDRHDLTVQQADALWDAIAIPGPREPTFTEQHERTCKTVARILAERPTSPSSPVAPRCPRCRPQSADPTGPARPPVTRRHQSTGNQHATSSPPAHFLHATATTGEPMASPYLNQPLTPARPRMFNTTIAKVIWTCAPILSAGLAAAVPFVVAAAKGVVKPWLAITYVVGEVAVFAAALAISPNGTGDSAVPGFLLTLLIITAATHTALLDNEKISVGK